MDPIPIEAPPGGVPVLLLESHAEKKPHILMLHGWSGDEKVMWVLQSVLPENAFIVSAQGIQPLPTGGYHWTDSPASSQVGFEDFEPAVAALEKTLQALKASHGFGVKPFLLMGFSQGAALAFACIRAGIRVHGIIALAGFLPFGGLEKLKDTPIFWGHGKRDELVPIKRAQTDVQRLLDAEAEVHYCEADVGHKLGIECTRGLRQWIQGRFMH